jgi:CRP-like cAMP-binding protein
MDRAIQEQSMYDAWNRITPIPKDLLKTFVQSLSLEHYPKGETLLKAGTTSQQSYFLLSGILRFYYTTDEGQEFNKAFYSKQQIVGPLSATIIGEASRYSIEVIEACDVFVIPESLFSYYMNKHLAWERLFSYCCQMMLVRNERREAELLLNTPKARYLQFVRNFPELVTRIPQYHIASYIGITPVALSRSRSDWEKEL